MSFPLLCPSCGAASGPFVGICPFCKSSLSTQATPIEGNHSTMALLELYQKGDYDTALILIKELFAAGKELSPSEIDSALIAARILLEVDAPSSQIRGLVGNILLLDPHHQQAKDLIELLDAKALFKKGAHDEGEVGIMTFLKSHPQDALAHFLLGSHLFWVEADLVRAVSHLERAVLYRPSFIRAWGCLGALYSRLDKKQHAINAFSQCLRLEKDKGMRQIFQNELKKVV